MLFRSPADASYYHYPYNAAYSAAQDYVPAGRTKSTSIVETLAAPGLRYHLTQNTAYPATATRARKFTAANGSIYKVRFNYLTNYDNTACVLQMDTSVASGAWTMNQYGTSTGYVEIALGDNPVEWISFGLYAKKAFTCPSPTGDCRR